MKFSLREWNISDVDSLISYANNFEIAKNMSDQFPHPYTSENASNFICAATKSTPAHILAIDINGAAVGGIGLHQQTDIFSKNAELGYWLAQPFWGKGIATEAVERIVVYGFNTFGFNRIFARPFGTNLASQKVLEKAGFILEGRFRDTIFKNGQYYDELVYAIRAPEQR
jgi:RimJ/RimL family protein N-acetyltransferase